jgi:hypothetical protein
MREAVEMAAIPRLMTIQAVAELGRFLSGLTGVPWKR